MSQHDSGVPTAMKIFGIFLLITVAGLIKGCSDIRYRISGVKTEATFTRISKGYARRGSPNHKFALYSFTDEDGNQCTGACRVSLDWSPPAETLPIEYFPGKREPGTTNTVSRLQGAGSVTAWVLLIVGVAGSGLFGFLMIRTMESARPD